MNNENNKIGELINFDLKQLNKIEEKLDNLVKLKLNLSINFYPYTLIKKEKIVKEKLLNIKKKLEEKWLELWIEIVENAWIEEKFYFDIISYILERYKYCNVIFDDVVIKYENWNSHLISIINKFLKRNNFNNIKVIKFDLNVIKKESKESILEALLLIDEKILKQISIVFEWVEIEEEYKKIEEVIEMYNKIRIKNKLYKDKFYVQWYLFSKPEEIK